MSSRTRKLLEATGFLALSSAPGLGWLLGIAVGLDTTAEESPRALRPAAPAGRRIGAGAVDMILALALSFVPFLGWLAASAFLLYRDHPALGGTSPGKRLFGLALEGQGSVWTDVKRNLLLALPALGLLLGGVEACLLLSGRVRLGDRIAGTRVVSSR